MKVPILISNCYRVGAVPTLNQMSPTFTGHSVAKDVFRAVSGSGFPTFNRHNSLMVRGEWRNGDLYGSPEIIRLIPPS